MANEEQLSILRHGVDVWNKWIAKNGNVQADLQEANLMGAELVEVDLLMANLSGAHLGKANLKYAKLATANLEHVDLSSADLTGANLERTNLKHAKLTRAKLDSADLNNANMSHADLSDAYLTKVNLRESLLIGTNLERADLREADLSGTRLGKAILVEANLENSNLKKADLNGASFRGAKLIRADLSEALMERAKLNESDLREANLWRANLIGSDFSHAQIGYTIFGNSNLSDVAGLITVHHRGPSSISTDTFTLSKGKIPDIFLRGCGLSDWEIEEVRLYNPDLSNEEINDLQYKVYDLRATQAVQISPLFLSYSHADSKFIDKMEKSFTKKGIRYWRDIHDMKSGRLEKQIDRAIRKNPTVLLVLSEHALNSDWVEHEFRTARELEKETKRDVLCPVALDESWKSSRWPKRVMEQIMEYNILDFSAWQDDSKFDGTFRKLIGGLELFYKG